MSNVIDCLQERGFIQSVTSNELRPIFSTPRSVYAGFDPTASSLHLGNYIPMMVLGWMQRHGHRPVVILGGATACIGDPGGKSTERPLLSKEEIAANVRSISRQFDSVFTASPAPVFLNNGDWLGAFSFLDFLRDVGKHFRLGPMIAKEMVRTRLESEEGISYTEFSYQLLQAYDFYYLFQKHQVVLQIGGSDQWGNITAGVEFVRKMTGEAVHGLSIPLLTRSDGKKFGKSEGGAIWLDSERFSPYQLYQYLLQIPDADVIKMLKMLTFLDMPTILAMERQMKTEDYIPHTAQKLLAREVTQQIHGNEKLETALRVTEALGPGAKGEINAEAIEANKNDLPRYGLTKAELEKKPSIAQVGVDKGFFSSKGEAARLVQNGGLSLNNEKVLQAHMPLLIEQAIEGKYFLISIGKKKKILLEIE